MTTRAQATAAPMPLMIGGRQYLMSPLTDMDLGTLDNWLRAQAINAAAASVAPDAPEGEYDRRVSLAIRVSATMTWASSAGAAALATLPGMAQFLWVGLKRHHPELTARDVESLISADPDAIAQAMRVFDTLQDSAKKKREPKRTETPEDRRREKAARREKKRQRRLAST